MVSFLVLFSNFYIHSYLAQRHRKHERQVVEYENNKENRETVANGDIVANGVASPYLKEDKKHNWRIHFLLFLSILEPFGFNILFLPCVS